MVLPKEVVVEFQQLYKTKYGVTLTFEEASIRATNLINLYKVVYGKYYFSEQIN